MVAFNFNVFGHDFEGGLMILRDSLTAAMAALDQQRERICSEYDAYKAALDRGEPPIGEWDEESGAWVCLDVGQVPMSAPGAERTFVGTNRSWELVYFTHRHRSLMQPRGFRLDSPDAVKPRPSSGASAARA